MHNAENVVQFTKVADAVCIVLVEIARSSLGDVLKSDSHKVVPLGGALHVIEAQCVQEFMHDCAHTEATLGDRVQFQIDALTPAVEETDVRVATAVVRLIQKILTVKL